MDPETPTRPAPYPKGAARVTRTSTARQATSTPTPSPATNCTILARLEALESDRASLQEALAQIQALTATLQSRNDQIADLESQVAALSQPAAPAPPLPGTMYANKAKLPAPQHHTAPRRRTPTDRDLAAAARHFTLPTGPTGYKYVVVPRAHRITQREVCKELRRMGLETSHILDVAFPSPSHVGLLTHCQYAPIVIDAFTRAKVVIDTTFDFLDPAHLSDPQFATFSHTQWAQTAASIHYTCCNPRHPPMQVTTFCYNQVHSDTTMTQ
ncbi:hypothetical protein IWQ60_010190 [Tieghemiomyces parasiticus]|uniref:Uncharacterized protein n=1 Tax=Tieghemiomyces parasiticus TaxID=78921 RepID=A0A9W7ZM84_9FUNG|nr:hypothetical protein IWQ60_010190 [Tieghemiomyces parasiticus]